MFNTRFGIRIDNLTHVYSERAQDAIIALAGVSLEIGAGELVAIVGANGSGKSTLARHLNGLLLPTSGDVWVDGLNTRDAATRQAIRAAVGMVFQVPEDQLVATIVQEDVAFGPENLGLPPAVVRARVREALDAVGMWEERARPSHMLSPGQQQRLAIAGALAMHPSCLALDEATAMLDPRGRRELWQVLDALHAEGMTVLYVTHDMDEAARAQRVVVLHQGRVALDDTPRRVFSQRDSLAEWGLALPSLAQIGYGLGLAEQGQPWPPLSMAELAQALRQAADHG